MVARRFDQAWGIQNRSGLVVRAPGAPPKRQARKQPRKQPTTESAAVRTSGRRIMSKYWKLSGRLVKSCRLSLGHATFPVPSAIPKCRRQPSPCQAKRRRPPLLHEVNDARSTDLLGLAERSRVCFVLPYCGDLDAIDE